MAKAPNPIAWNPDCMSISQAKVCCDTLRTLFTLIGRDAEDAEIVHSLKRAREDMLSEWGAAK